MNKKNTQQKKISMLLLILLIFTGSVSVIFSTPSKLDWYLMFKKKSSTHDDDMDRQLFGLKKKKMITGRVFALYGKQAIKKASVSIYNQRGKLLQKILTDNNGIFSANIPAAPSIQIKISHKYYAEQTKSYQRRDYNSPLLLPMIAAYKYQLYKNREITVQDNTGKISLTVHASILKRIDNRTPHFPVIIRIAYIDPRTGLDAMPGRQMLSVTSRDIIKPLISWGAALISAYDATGTRVVVDYKKMRQLKRPTELRFSMDWFINNRDIKKRDISFSSWQIYPGSNTWKPSYQEPTPIYTRRYQEGNVTSKSKWKTSIRIRAIELAPLNLDRPKKAVPVLFTFKQRGGKGRFKVSVEGQEAKGKFKVSQFFNTTYTAYFRLLLPDIKQISVSIYTGAKQTSPILRRQYNVPRKVATFRFNKEKQIRDTIGREPVWHKMGLLLF